MREIKLFIIGAKVCEKIKHLIKGAIRLGIGFINLVQNNDWPQTQSKRLGCHKFSLWHRAFGGIDQQDNTVHHAQNTLNLTAEIGVARRVDDIDPLACPFERCAFGQNRNAAFAFDVIAVHRPFGHGLIFAKRARLFK